MNVVIYSALIIGALGLIFGIGLGIAAKIFEVKVDPLVPVVRDLLPGANCGGCGFAGCDAFAKAVVAGEITPEKCPVNNEENTGLIAEKLGMTVEVGEKKTAFVMCNGNCENASEKYEYFGIKDCVELAALQGGGSKSCTYGCLGMGSCVNACQFDAIHVVDGIAVVDEEKCVACGACVTACPKDLIEIIPAEKQIRVTCMSNDKGKEAKSNCKVACIGCRMCVKACEFEAINVDNFLAKIDYEKCTECGACVEKCPTKAIVDYRS